MKLEIEYYVIYTLDVLRSAPERLTLKHCKPALVKCPRFQVTETEVEEPEYTRQHRTYVGRLKPEELPEFISQIYACSTCQTMGSLSFEYGLIPAISFETDSYCDGYYDNAYISPVGSQASEQELNKLLNEMPEEQRQAILEAEVSPVFDKLMKALEQYFQDEEKAVEVLTAEYSINPSQYQLEFDRK